MSANAVVAAIPEGYIKDAKGRLIPLDLVSKLDMERDVLVKELTAEALKLHHQMVQFKLHVAETIAGFEKHSAREYKAKVGGEKGNITLQSYDGSLKVMRAISDRLVFDERLQVAKTLIDTCINKWSVDARPEIKTLVNDAFQVDKQGNVSTGRILGLRRLAIKDRAWGKAMEAISDSIHVASSAVYFRFYQRIGDGEKYTQLSLDLASV